MRLLGWLTRMAFGAAQLTGDFPYNESAEKPIGDVEKGGNPFRMLWI